MVAKPILLGRPGWVLSGASLDFDFAGRRYWQGSQKPSDALLTVSRASVGYVDDSNGLWYATAAGAPRIADKGLLVEESRTNVVLWNRDLTNVAWTASSVTAVLDQTGIDGAANSASRIAASAGNGTILQAITLGSSARFQSAFVKRLAGSGVINMTMDNGATWTAITVTSAWTQVTVPTQTLANPTVGFQIVANGDSIAVDFVQNENSGNAASSPILVTSAAATRAADVITVTGLPVFGASYSVYAAIVPAAAAGAGNSQTILSIDDGSASNRAQIERTVPTGVTTGFVNPGAGSMATTGASTTGVLSKHAMACAPSDSTAVRDGGTPATTGSGTPPSSGVTTLHIGSRFNGAFQLNGYIRRVAVFLSRLGNAQLQAMTT